MKEKTYTTRDGQPGRFVVAEAVPRCPKRNEWFLNSGGYAQIAMFDFYTDKHPILMKIQLYTAPLSDFIVTGETRFPRMGEWFAYGGLAYLADANLALEFRKILELKINRQQFFTEDLPPAGPFVKIGEVRLPRSGEYYLMCDRAAKAMKDFQNCPYPILTRAETNEGSNASSPKQWFGKSGRGPFVETGEVRLPQAGEFYLSNSLVMISDRGFTCTPYPIVREVTMIEKGINTLKQKGTAPEASEPAKPTPQKPYDPRWQYHTSGKCVVCKQQRYIDTKSCCLSCAPYKMSKEELRRSQLEVMAEDENSVHKPGAQNGPGGIFDEYRRFIGHCGNGSTPIKQVGSTVSKPGPGSGKVVKR